MYLPLKAKSTPPVISKNQTATKNVSSFLDFHLKQIVPTISYMSEDTENFLKRISDSSEIVTFDIVGLYPHEPHEEGIENKKEYLNLRVI